MSISKLKSGKVGMENAKTDFYIYCYFYVFADVLNRRFYAFLIMFILFVNIHPCLYSDLKHIQNKVGGVVGR